MSKQFSMSQNKIVVLPLEPMEERYTEQWHRWYQDELVRLKIPYVWVEGDRLTETVEVGTVLDAAGTNYWKFSQLMEVCRLFHAGEIHDGDAFYTMDIWHPGLEAIRYMATLYKLDVKIYGFLHAGSFTKEDFAEPMSDWAIFFEKGWVQLSDGIFMGTDYGPKQFGKLRLQPGINQLNQLRKIHVVGYPLNKQEAMHVAGVDKLIPAQKREKIIVYSHRFDKEKRPDVFIDIMEELWEMRQDFKVIFTTSRPTFRSNDPRLIDKLMASNFNFEIAAGLSKGEYYKILSQAKLMMSTTIEEYFGLCVQEAMMFETPVIVPDDFSHPYLLQGNMNFMWNTRQEALMMADAYLDNSPNIQYLYDEQVSYWANSIERLLRIIINS